LPTLGLSTAAPRFTLQLLKATRILSRYDAKQHASRLLGL
jgi:hypothetical protein